MLTNEKTMLMSLKIKIIRQLLAAAFIDQVAVRKDIVEPSSSGSKFATTKGVPYKALNVAEDMFIHPSSVLANRPPPEWIVYSEAVRTSKLWMKGVTIINPAWLSSLGESSLCTFPKPVKNAEGTLMIIPRFGPQGWELPAIPATKGYTTSAT
jgi:ATP-dependent RNA helicase DHX37/DHR1